MGMWGHPHVSASSTIQLSRTIHLSLSLFASQAALFRDPTSGSHYASHACSLSKPRLLVKPATQASQRQSKQTSWVRDKMRPPSRSSFIRSLIQALNAHHIKRHISRRKKQRQTARPRCLVDRALHHWGRPSDIYRSWLLSHAQLRNSLYNWLR